MIVNSLILRERGLNLYSAEAACFVKPTRPHQAFSNREVNVVERIRILQAWCVCESAQLGKLGLRSAGPLRMSTN